MANREPPAQAAPGSAPVKTGLPSTDRRQLAESVGKALAETYVLYTFGEFLELSDIRETREKQTAEQAVMMLCADHEMAACTFREATRMATDCDDVVTADLLTERMGVHEKAAWMLRSLVRESAVQRTAAPTEAKRQ